MTKARDIADSTTTLDVDGGTIKLDGNYPVGTGNVALGDAALDSVTSSGNYNTAVGYQAGYSNTTAGGTTAIGHQAGYANTTGVRLTALGLSAGVSNTTGGYNTALGYQALRSNQTGASNVAVGENSMYYNTGNSNTAVGRGALLSNTTASNNTAVGYQAGFSNTTGAENTFLGYQAGKAVTTGSYQTIIGGFAGQVLTTGANNTLVGNHAGDDLTTGSYNCFVGARTSGSTYSGGKITTGSKNTILGSYNGNQGGLDIRTSSNNIVLSDGDGNPRVWHTGSYLASPTVYSFPVSGRDVYVDSNGTIGYLSSVRQSKTNIVDFTDASWLLNLSPKTFNYRTKDADNNYTDQAEGELYYGLIADEVETVNPDLCFYNEVDGQQELAGVSYSKMITPMLKLIQEQQATITALTARITALEGA